MKKPYIKKEGNFLVAATYPLEYPGYSKPVRKSLESLRSFEKKGYTFMTKGHKDSNGKFEIIGELRGLNLKEKELDSNKEGELYAKEMILFRKGITDLQPGVYGLSPDFLYSANSMTDTDEAYTLEDGGIEFTSVALVKDPRHRTKDIDLTNLREEVVRSMYDSSSNITKIEELPVVIIGETSIALQDSNSCDIVPYMENNKKLDIQELVKTFASSLSSLIKGESEGKDLKEDLEMNKEELELILDSKVSQILEDKLGSAIEKATVALQDSLETSVNAAVASNLEALKEAAPINNKENDKSIEEGIITNEDILKELESVKQERDELKLKVSEQETLLQTMDMSNKGKSAKSKNDEFEVDADAGVKTGSDSKFDLAATLSNIKKL